MQSLTQTLALRISAVLGALGVALGAFGAHALKAQLTAAGRLDTWQTAVFYHLVHAVVLVALCLAPQWRPRAWLCMALGVLVFSGSLYLLCLSGLSWLGAVTPLGGIAMIVGWLLLLRSARSC